MMIDPKHPDASEAPGHYKNQGADGQGTDSSRGREEDYQRRKDQAPVGAANNLAPAGPSDREQRIRSRAHELWEQQGHPEGLADDHWHQAAREVDEDDLRVSQTGGGTQRS